MNNKIKALIGILVFVLVIGAAVFAYNALRDNTPETPDVLSPGGAAGDMDAREETESPAAPDFTVVDAAGNEVKLSELFGKPIVLNFWASWCPPCKEEMPEFNKVYEEVGGNVTFVMVDLVDGQRETKEKGEKHIADQGYTFPVYFDTKGEAASVYGISSIPTTLFIDRNGRIVTGVQGAIDEITLRRGIDLIK